MANTPAWFIKEDYLASKLAQLIASGETEYETPEQVEEAIEAEGFTAFEHFEKFGGEEKTSPNAYFDVAYYLQAKADELNANADEPRDDWTAEEVYDAIIAEGLTPWSHFQAWGWKEGVNPSADFDLNAYFEEKLQQLIDTGETEYETVDDVIAAFEANGIDPITHYYAWGADEGLTPKSAHDAELGKLTEALEVYQDAVEAREEFLAEAAETLGLADDAPEEDILLEIDGAVDAAQTELTAAGTYDYTDASADVTAAMIADDRAKLAEDLQDAEDAINAVAGFKTAVNALLSAEKRLEQAEDAEDAAETTFNGELGRVNGIDPTLGYVLNGGFDGDVDLVFLEDADGEPVIVLDPVTNKLVVDEDADVEDVEGFDALLASAQNYYAATVLVELRAERVLDAQARVDEFDAVVEGGDAQALVDAYTDAQDAIEAFEDAVSAYETAAELQAALAAHDDAVEGAVEAIAELGYNLVEFDANDEAVGTEESDVFVYIGADEAIIDLFGEVGDDVLFIGTEYTFNDDIENGDASVLEVFFTQDGDDVVVTIEQVPFGTNADVQEIDTITLTGVSIDNLVFDQGYVQFVA